MAEVNVYYNPTGNTLTVWYGDRHTEYLCEETGDEVILMKNQQGEVIGVEKLNYTVFANTTEPKAPPITSENTLPAMMSWNLLAPAIA